MSRYAVKDKSGKILSWDSEKYKKTGVFNLGGMSFRNDPKYPIYFSEKGVASLFAKYIVGHGVLSVVTTHKNKPYTRSKTGKKMTINLPKRKNPKRKNPKRETVKFYTDSGLYKGWSYFTRENYHNEVKNWINSGNKVVIGKKVYSSINKPALLLKLKGVRKNPIGWKDIYSTKHFPKGYYVLTNLSNMYQDRKSPTISGMVRALLKSYQSASWLPHGKKSYKIKQVDKDGNLKFVKYLTITKLKDGSAKASYPKTQPKM